MKSTIRKRLKADFLQSIESKRFYFSLPGFWAKADNRFKFKFAELRYQSLVERLKVGNRIESQEAVHLFCDHTARSESQLKHLFVLERVQHKKGGGRALRQTVLVIVEANFFVTPVNTAWISA